MRTAQTVRGIGIAIALLEYILNHTNHQGYKHVSLETGSMPFFEPARNLYKKFGFTICVPFADYKIDPNSVFMLKKL